MKIVHVLYYPGQGGAEQYMYLLAKYARRDGHEVEFVFGEKGPFEKRVKELGCPVNYVKMRSPFDLKAVWQLSKRFRKTGADVVHTHFLRESFLAAAALKIARGKALFQTVHRVERKTKLQALFNRVYSVGITRFIAVSPLAKDVLVSEGIKTKKIVEIINGVEIGAIDKLAIRKEINIDDSHKIITYVGRMMPEKGHELLLKAFSFLKNKNYSLVLVGDGDLRGKLEAMAKELGIADRVYFTGYRDRGYEVTGISDIYVQPSDIEVMPLSVIEAMLLGVPVVASKIPAHEILLQEGEFGSLFETQDSSDLTKQIEICLEQPEVSLRKAKEAFAYAKDRYAAEIMWKSTFNLYQKFVAEK